MGRIMFSDVPSAAEEPFELLSDIGTMGLALLGPAAEHRMAEAEPRGLGGKSGDTAEVRPWASGSWERSAERCCCARANRRTVHFVVTWHFPNLTLAGLLKGRYYATRFPNAAAVALGTSPRTSASSRR